MRIFGPADQTKSAVRSCWKILPAEFMSRIYVQQLLPVMNCRYCVFIHSVLQLIFRSSLQTS